MPSTLVRPQRSLNLFLPVAPGKEGLLLSLLKNLDAATPNPLHEALRALNNVHFAQFVMLPTPWPPVVPPTAGSAQASFLLAVLTIYDGDFDEYIVSFVERIGGQFDKILAHIQGAEPVTPVADHRDGFVEFIRRHTIEVPLFSAYPDRRMFDIKDALRLQ